MGDKTYIGVRASRLESGEKLMPYTGVIVNFEGDDGETQSYTAGTVSGENAGSVLEVEIPWATQAIANSLLTRVQGYTYTPFTAQDARLDPAAELGDGVTVGDVYGVLASRKSDARAIEADEIGADYDEEFNHEFKYESPVERSIRTIRRATVELRIETDAIVAQVTDEDGNYTVLNLKSDGLHVGSASGTTTIAGSSIEAGSLNLSDNLSFNAVGNAAASADALAKALAAGTPISAAVGTFINGRNIYSPNIYTNMLTLQPPQATQQWSGGLDLKGYYNGNLYDMFRLSYAEYDRPNVEMWSPDDAVLWIRDFYEMYVNCPILVGSMTRGTQDPIQRGIQGENGQIYFQIVG